MKRELDRKLVEKFPIIYRARYRSMQETCMYWGFSCGSGWYDIIYDLSVKLEKIAESQPPPKEHHPLKKLLWPLIDKISERIRRLARRPYSWPVGKKPKEPSFWKVILKEKILDKFWWDVYGFFMPPEDNRLKATQVKEKFSTLRYYTNYTSDEIEKAIIEAEKQSAITCETCGEKGKSRNNRGWLVTLCDEHWKEYLDERTEKKLA